MKKQIINIIIPSLILLGYSSLVSAQTNSLESYIEEGLKNNLVLNQKNISWEKAMIGLQSAKSFYLPTVGFQTTYSTADGGRNIPLPLGDLLNGVYSTLNDLTQSQRFTELENTEIGFLPKNYYDAKIRTTVPILNSDIRYGVKLSEQQIVLKEYELEIYKQELIKNIKIAYYNYLSALQVVDIYKSSQVLAQEGKRVNEKLYESGKGLPVYIMRSESEIAQINADFSKAKQQAENAKLYFNSLLNRSPESDIDSSLESDTTLRVAEKLLLQEININKRSEIQSLNQALTINETLLNKDEQYFIPKLSGFLDLGSQAEGLHFNKDSRYYMIGLQLDIPIFSGMRNKYKIKETRLNLQYAKLELENAKQNLNLSAEVAKNKLKSAFEVYQASMEQLKAANSYQRLIDRGYQAGVNTFIETIDARNQLTAAQLASQINKYNVLISAAELERELNINP
ncbi:TolC family protein [Albibacterium sp.]|uniref:TolC family protein n=1 Tax=Albibacterium sp. TaxID=2952885 RepID=UPI002CAB3E78|nr:TolC family protein [Albibacterium sp.]HUH19056.1 TolC family protein [Albibacterium sp.]